MVPRRSYALLALGIASLLVHPSCGSKSAPVTPSPIEATPTPVAAETPVPCGDPKPPAIDHFNMAIHLVSGLYWTLDSTPIVYDRAYCKAIGFTDGRLKCPTRPEGHPERVACDALAAGKAVDTGRPGPTWRRDGNLCTGIDSGCDNSPDNQFQVLVYWHGQGTYTACAETGACGSIYAEGPK